jgi:hypothetical protein
MMTRIILPTVCAAALSGCATPVPMLLVRTDGQHITGNAALTQQMELDKTICRGEAEKAGLSAGTNYYGGVAAIGEEIRRDRSTNTVAEGCLAQRGYAWVPASQAVQISEAYAATQERAAEKIIAIRPVVDNHGARVSRRCPARSRCKIQQSARSSR